MWKKQNVAFIYYAVRHCAARQAVLEYFIVCAGRKAMDNLMTTYEKTKHELLLEMRSKREAKKQAKEKAMRRRRIVVLATLVSIVTVTFGAVYSVSAKDVTITEIDEFAGTNETKNVKTLSNDVETVLEKHGVDITETDRLNVPVEKQINDKEDIIIKRGKRVTIKAGDCESVVTVTKVNVHDALVEAGYIPGEHDVISSNGDTLAEGDMIELVSISHTDEIVTEAVPRGVEYVDAPDLPEGTERVIDEGQDGIKEVSHKVTYQDGEEAAREAVGENIIVEARNKVIARGTATPTPEPKATAPQSRSNGTINGHSYSRKITMTATAYSTSPAENGGSTRSAMGTPLGYGIVAVDPKVIPLGSRVYVTSADGSWTYGIASAEDTGGAIKGNKIDLCYPDGSHGFGKRSCVVYILD